MHYSHRLENEILVSFSGTVPNLFSRVKAVAEGRLVVKIFLADRILANMMKIICHPN